MRPASEAERARLGETFAAICAIPSPSGQEDACAAHVRSLLEGIGIAVEEDAAGNLLARIAPPRGSAGPASAGADAGSGGSAGPDPAGADAGSGGSVDAGSAGAGGLAESASAGPGGPAEPWILFCAHMDTVPLAAPVEPVVVDGGWENANAGILGADNKAAVAVVLELARRVKAEGAPVGIELAFTRGEEIGLVGARALDRSALHASFGVVFDSAAPVGGVVMASPTIYRIEAEFHGRAAHAGLRPEDGHSAIRAAAQAITRMPHGRIDDETTANVGDVRGGEGATNVVPDRCRLLAETRSLDAARAEEVVSGLVDALQDAAADGACDVDIITEKQISGYRLRPSAPAVVAAEAALRARGYEPRRLTGGGGSDVNALIAAGLPCVNLSNGTERNHEPTERISIASLDGTFDVALALLDEAAVVLQGDGRAATAAGPVEVPGA